MDHLHIYVAVSKKMLFHIVPGVELFLHIINLLSTIVFYLEPDQMFNQMCLNPAQLAQSSGESVTHLCDSYNNATSKNGAANILVLSESIASAQKSMGQKHMRPKIWCFAAVTLENLPNLQPH